MFFGYSVAAAKAEIASTPIMNTDPMISMLSPFVCGWWAFSGLNRGPSGYEPGALTN